MTKRPSIQAKLQQSQPPADSSQAAKVQSASAGAASMVQSRVGKVNVSAYFPPEVKSSLRLVQAKRGGKIQDLLAEALNMRLPNTGYRRLRPPVRIRQMPRRLTDGLGSP